MMEPSMIIFLRKYHAGEAGVGAASVLFVLMLALALIGSKVVRVSMSEGTRMGVSAPLTGHGLTSGIVMAMAKSALARPGAKRFLAARRSRSVEWHRDEDRAEADADDVLLRHARSAGADAARFSSAGHLDPYVYRAATGTLDALSSWGFSLGVRRREPFREHMIAFEAGGRLIQAAEVGVPHSRPRPFTESFDSVFWTEKTKLLMQKTATCV